MRYMTLLTLASMLLNGCTTMNEPSNKGYTGTNEWGLPTGYDPDKSSNSYNIINTRPFNPKNPNDPYNPNSIYNGASWLGHDPNRGFNSEEPQSIFNQQ